jgi:hypothetical protein
MRTRTPIQFRRLAFVPALVLAACTTPDKTALKDYAPKSPDAAIEAVSLSASDNDTFDPSRVGTEFPDTTKQVAVWYRWSSANPGKNVAIRWSKGGDVILEQSDTLAKASGASAYVLKTASGSHLPVGNYEVELLENGTGVTKIPFKVGTGESTADVAVTPKDTGSQSEPAPAAAEPVGKQEESGQAAAEAPAQAATPEPLPAGAPSNPGVLGSQETKWPGVVVELTEFVRKGKTLNAKLRYTNKGTKELKPEFYYRDTYVLDENNKKYEVIKDEKGGYIGSVSAGYNYWWGEQIEPGASRMVWMRFEAPPAEVKAMTLQVGGLDPFEEVPIQN